MVARHNRLTLDEARHNILVAMACCGSHWLQSLSVASIFPVNPRCLRSNLARLTSEKLTVRVRARVRHFDSRALHVSSPVSHCSFLVSKSIDIEFDFEVPPETYVGAYMEPSLRLLHHV